MRLIVYILAPSQLEQASDGYRHQCPERSRRVGRKAPLVSVGSLGRETRLTQSRVSRAASRFAARPLQVRARFAG